LRSFAVWVYAMGNVERIKRNVWGRVHKGLGHGGVEGVGEVTVIEASKHTVSSLDNGQCGVERQAEH